MRTAGEGQSLIDHWLPPQGNNNDVDNMGWGHLQPVLFLEQKKPSIRLFGDIGMNSFVSECVKLEQKWILCVEKQRSCYAERDTSLNQDAGPGHRSSR